MKKNTNTCANLNFNKFDQLIVTVLKDFLFILVGSQNIVLVLRIMDTNCCYSVDLFLSNSLEYVGSLQCSELVGLMLLM
jgi:hypothetical protein